MFGKSRVSKEGPAFLVWGISPVPKNTPWAHLEREHATRRVQRNTATRIDRCPETIRPLLSSAFKDRQALACNFAHYAAMDRTLAKAMLTGTSLCGALLAVNV